MFSLWKVSTGPYLETWIVSACQSKICLRFMRLRSYILVLRDQGHLAQSNQLVQMSQGSFIFWWTKPLCLQITGPAAGSSSGNHSPPHSHPLLCWHKHPAESMSCAYCISPLLQRLTWLMYSLGMMFKSRQSCSDKNTTTAISNQIIRFSSKYAEKLTSHRRQELSKMLAGQR